MNTTNTLSYATPTCDNSSRPWLPGQLIAASFLFGPLAGAIVAGVNFTRLGNKSMRTTTIVLGTVVFLIEVFLLLALPENALQPMGTLVNIGFGFVLMLIQKPYFEQWKARHWRPTAPKQQYRPNELGTLFLAAIAGLIVEVAVILMMLVATGQLA